MERFNHSFNTLCKMNPWRYRSPMNDTRVEASNANFIALVAALPHTDLFVIRCCVHNRDSIQQINHTCRLDQQVIHHRVDSQSTTLLQDNDLWWERDINKSLHSSNKFLSTHTRSSNGVWEWSRLVLFPEEFAVVEPLIVGKVHRSNLLPDRCNELLVS